MSAAPPVSKEARDRKARTEAALRAAQVPVLDHLPVICDSKVAHRRTLEQVVHRLMVVGRVQGLACAPPDMRASCASSVRDEMKTGWPQLWEAASESERHFMSVVEQAEPSLINLASWKAETVWVLLWALRVVDELPLCPAHQCNLSAIPNVMKLIFASSLADFLGHAADTLRVKQELRAKVSSQAGAGAKTAAAAAAATGAASTASATGTGNASGAGDSGTEATAPATPTSVALRPLEELLEAADRIYRWHWAVRQYRFVAKLEAGQRLTEDDIVMNGVTEEWHRTLNWLITDSNWDSVDTST